MTTLFLAAAWASALAEPVLPPGRETSTADAIYQCVDELDAQADRAWQALPDRAAYDAYRTNMHARMLAALGEFPARTPLNARTLASFKRDGYRIEKVIFESMPGLFVPANVFVPTSAAESSPCPAVVLSCGHSGSGKDAEVYLRACVLLARRGLVACMFDPYEQGERTQGKRGCTQEHNQIGVRATLLGSSMATLRIWDGMRAIDYVSARNDVDPSRVGYMGQSGGGTMTALMTAVDWRLKATAPSCYLTSLRYLCKCQGPQDAEQNVFGQLSFGLNHTGYVLMPDTKVCVTGRYNDMFPWGGSADLFRVVRDVAAKVGNPAHYGLNFAPGPHGWTESTETASADWMVAWLLNRPTLLPLDMPAYRALDLGFDLAQADVGLAPDERGVTPGRNVLKLDGATDIFTILRNRFVALRAAWPHRTAAAKSDLAFRFAKIKRPNETGIRVKATRHSAVQGCSVTGLAFMYPDGFALPGWLVEPVRAQEKMSPWLMVGSRGRADFDQAAEAAVSRGAAVLVLDLSGYGEIGKPHYTFYGAKETPEEGAALMLYLMGESMVGRRATEILFAASWLKSKYGAPVAIEARGSAVIPAAHAYAAVPETFAEVRTSAAPAAWSDVLLQAENPKPYRFANVIHGALREYDWPQLLPNAQ